MKYIIHDIDHLVFDFSGVTSLDVEQLTECIRTWDGWKNFTPNQTRIVFPGNGATDVRARLGEEWLKSWQTDNVSATRFWWPGTEPGAVVGLISKKGSFDFSTTDVVIIDDVISSGTTVSKIREQNAIWMPKTHWHAVAWIKQRACRLKGFESTFFGVEVGEKNRRVPINSLSTLLTNVEIAESYARRNFPNPEDFLTALAALR
ncbi:MAG: hypothetical protein UV82_C0010G0046 [Candidatus Magasanikbacteria bacterium GW2011_GWD2_43_18]|uniref:Phosphoribosyltransferase domain-containing protein n=1 Tax=Candidatus Magasanikbacteria bacterium GW2011_GWE2_42_7 TaxID=1619052 RepID=A0A0G1EC28_9BACT|nr:MAG: hypothetical protein UV18_C0005G0136 [Candidatus Magasanikbacteria bacterium GW2011_GWC2_42_27]KKS72143.1 MAG: hypothetical protein UV42_C0013G0021 [Candidatus Magasanikbacteria bacterium GW2011_GWE2_42_7]KKT04230.1 MAG: hypothetical protein UV82_C0010G0046 [Candidatus Magasanikbacteria bacterium GW2011_GWD2_43_18]KKT25926.1 MAG: hypothetical protein UW10_C0003G0087 [Candidatus Magasanikbacteria bacterium GW2011_GWA2_43_9]HBB37902.1 hypothetical protein [Candidatus Magasanikbacteria bac